MKPSFDAILRFHDTRKADFPLFIYVQILLGLAAQVAIYFFVDVYWAICATPLTFAAVAAINLTDMDGASERRVKSILTWLTFGSIALAVAARTFLR